MGFGRSVLPVLAVAAVLAGGADALGKGHRLAVTVTRVGPKTPVGQPIEIRSRVRWRGKRAELTYDWSTVAGPPLPDGVDTSARVLVLPANSLEPGQKYHVRLVVTAPGEEGNRIEASSDVKFVANEAPKGGSCTIKAKAVRGRVLRIGLAAPGWSDPDGVQYRFELRSGKRLVAVQNWRHFNTFATTVRLKPGQRVFGRCLVRDKFGDGLTLDTRRVSGPDGE
jgi:hypothetical protein